MPGSAQFRIANIVAYLGIALTFAAAGIVALFRYQNSQPPIQSETFPHVAFFVVLVLPALWVMASRWLLPPDYRVAISLASGVTLILIGMITFSPLGLLLFPAGALMIFSGVIALRERVGHRVSAMPLVVLAGLGVAAVIALLYTGGTEACWREVTVAGERTFERVPFTTHSSLEPGESAMYCTERAPTLAENAISAGVAAASLVLVSVKPLWSR